MKKPTQSKSMRMLLIISLQGKDAVLACVRQMLLCGANVVGNASTVEDHAHCYSTDMRL